MPPLVNVRTLRKFPQSMFSPLSPGSRPNALLVSRHSVMVKATRGTSGVQRVTDLPEG